MQKLHKNAVQQIKNDVFTSLRDYRVNKCLNAKLLYLGAFFNFSSLNLHFLNSTYVFRHFQFRYQIGFLRLEWFIAVGHRR